MKREVRLLGIDDGPFIRGEKKNVLVVGTIFRGGNFMDGLLSTYVKQDGSNATTKLISLVNRAKFKPQLQCILLNGIALGGFNVVDIKKLWQKTKLPVICVIRAMPDLKKIRQALSHVSGAQRKWSLILHAPPIKKIDQVYCQWVGIHEEKVCKIIAISTTHGKIPEPLRIAHIIARGIVMGESKGRA